MMWQNNSGTRDSVNPPRRGNNVNYDIDNLTNRYDSGGEKMIETGIHLQKELAQS